MYVIGYLVVYFEVGGGVGVLGDFVEFFCQGCFQVVWVGIEVRVVGVGSLYGSIFYLLENKVIKMKKVGLCGLLCSLVLLYVGCLVFCEGMFDEVQVILVLVVFVVVDVLWCIEDVGGIGFIGEVVEFGLYVGCFG